MPKYPRYQDYVIKAGKFVGEFEEMYQDYDDPWEQSLREEDLSYKAITLFLCKKYNFKRVLELGCGHGHFSKDLAKAGMEVVGVDISPTAIAKAKELYPQCDFICGDVLDFDIYKKVDPDCIIFAEVTWYILDNLKAFLDFYKTWAVKDVNRPIYLLHLLAIYQQGVQQYGKEFFTNLQGIIDYFGLDYEEYGAMTYKKLDYASRTYFLGKPFVK